MDPVWMDDELMMDWLMHGRFPLFYLLTCISEKCRKISRILFFRNSIFPEKLQHYM